MHEVRSESEVAPSCPTLCNPMDCSLPGSSIHGIFQARALEWGAIAFSKLKVYSKIIQLQYTCIYSFLDYFPIEVITEKTRNLFCKFLLSIYKNKNSEKRKKQLCDLPCNWWYHNGTLLQYPCLENPMDGGAWWAAIYGVAQSRTRLSDFTLTFHFHALEKDMATHSSVLAWRIPGTGEPGGLPSVGLHRVGHDWSDLAAAAPMWKDVIVVHWRARHANPVGEAPCMGLLVKEGNRCISWLFGRAYCISGRHSLGS